MQILMYVRDTTVYMSHPPSGNSASVTQQPENIWVSYCEGTPDGPVYSLASFAGIEEAMYQAVKFVAAQSG